MGGYGLVATSFHPYGGSSSNYRTTQGLSSYGYYGYGKRSAEPGYGIGVGFSAVQQSRPYYHGSYGYNINHVYGKKSAEPSYGIGLVGYGLAATAFHPDGVSSTDRSPQGLSAYGYGKRDAEPGYGIGYGLAATSFHPYGGLSSNYRTTQGLSSYGYYGYGKRSAEPGYIYGINNSQQYVSKPYSSYAVNVAHPY